jgi:allene oxide cyclase
VRKAWIVTGVVGVVVLGIVVAAVASGPKVRGPMTIRVVERPATDKVIDTGKNGDSSGDLLTFHNRLFDSHNAQRVGRDQGDCVRISPKHGTWECRWVSWIEGGSIAVEGPFYDAKDSTMAITGGTGMFRNARGSLTLHARKDGAFLFTYDVIPGGSQRPQQLEQAGRAVDREVGGPG